MSGCDDIDSSQLDDLLIISKIENLLDTLIKYGISNELNLSDLKVHEYTKKYSNILEKCCILSNIGKISKRKRKLDEFYLKNKPEIKKHKTCYICRERTPLKENEQIFSNVSMNFKCTKCEHLNETKRSIKTDLQNKVAIVTGARVKIGFETAIRLLECGCQVIATSRFVGDMICRYQAHPKYNEFKHLVTFYAIDLRYMNDINNFYNYVKNKFVKLDILIHNAAQTIRRPKEFYQHMIPNEKLQCGLLTNGENELVSNCSTVVLPNGIDKHLFNVFNVLESDDLTNFPNDSLDANGEQIDLRKSNTWTKTLENVEIKELTELLTINTVSPFYMNQLFIGMLKNANGSYIVNVSSMEGVFNMKTKSKNHPHTNMAKAALNMMTRTSAQDYYQHKIYMVSVDTGWVTNEFPHGHKSQNHTVPLDNLDGACRVLDPVFDYFNGKTPVYGVFLKDYMVSDW